MCQEKEAMDKPPFGLSKKMSLRSQTSPYHQLSLRPLASRTTPRQSKTLPYDLLAAETGSGEDDEDSEWLVHISGNKMAFSRIMRLLLPRHPLPDASEAE